MMRINKRQASSLTVEMSDFDDVYRSYLHPVYSFVAYRVGHKEAAEDLTSQVFEKAWQAWSGFDPSRANVSTWLFTIARNALTDHYRRQGRNRESTLEENSEVAGANPVSELESQDLRRELAIAIRGLDDREKEILSLKFGARLTNRQIAEVLGISESNAGTILFRSLKRLKVQLEGGNEND